jgi:hypothetical protein
MLKSVPSEEERENAADSGEGQRADHDKASRQVRNWM